MAPGGRQAHQWTCRSCAHDYDLGAIEAQLVAAARAQARAYQLQDLRCRKCRQVGALVEHMHRVCVAGGAHVKGAACAYQLQGLPCRERRQVGALLGPVRPFVLGEPCTCARCRIGAAVTANTYKHCWSLHMKYLQGYMPSACYLWHTFDPLSESHSTQCSRVTVAEFRPCLTCCCGWWCTTHARFWVSVDWH